jgi:hypothetical protein
VASRLSMPASPIASAELGVRTAPSTPSITLA